MPHRFDPFPRVLDRANHVESRDPAFRGDPPRDWQVVLQVVLRAIRSTTWDWVAPWIDLTRLARALRGCQLGFDEHGLDCSITPSG